MSTEETRERVLTFLYGGLTADEEAVFRADLQADPELAQALAEEERFQQRLPVGAGAQVSDRLLDESRMLVRAALRRQADSAPSIRARLSEFFRGMVPQIPQIAYAGGVVAMLLCGILLGRTVLGPSTGPDLAVAPEQVVDIQVKSFDPASGRVRLALSTLSATVLEGSLEDEQVQKVLAAALLGDLEPGPRLQAVELLRDQTASVEIRQALIHSLLHDENPGVRVGAVEALRELAGDAQVRQALQQALLGDYQRRDTGGRHRGPEELPRSGYAPGAGADGSRRQRVCPRRGSPGSGKASVRGIRPAAGIGPAAVGKRPLTVRGTELAVPPSRGRRRSES